MTIASMRNDSGLLARAGMRIADACERWFPDAFVFALAAIVIGRRIRKRSRLMLAALPGARVARLGRLLGYAGMYLALTAALAVGFYAVLTYIST
jgi:hypothetical protein